MGFVLNFAVEVGSREMGNIDLPKGMNIPPGVNIRQNIQIAMQHKLNVVWFFNQVKTGGPWDYKKFDKSPKSKYEDFGNFHYGVVGKATGIPRQLLLRAAGLYQIKSGTSPNKLGIFTSPYGDDSKDQTQINRGIDFYDNLEL